jgi:chorismate mutase
MPTRRALLVLGLLLPTAGPLLAADDGAATLAGLIALRLDLAERVAETKWNSGQPIADPPREAKVVVAFVTQAAGRGLPPGFARAFIQAQIAASRLVQSELHAAWRAAGRGPFAAPPDLQRDLRPRFDALTQALVAALAAAAASLEQPAWRAAVANAGAAALAGRTQAVRQAALAPFAPGS